MYGDKEGRVRAVERFEYCKVPTTTAVITIVLHPPECHPLPNCAQKRDTRTSKDLRKATLIARRRLNGPPACVDPIAHEVVRLRCKEVLDQDAFRKN